MPADSTEHDTWTCSLPGPYEWLRVMADVHDDDLGTCPACDGTGYERDPYSPYGWGRCSRCYGRGEVPVW